MKKHLRLKVQKELTGLRDREARDSKLCEVLKLNGKVNGADNLLLFLPLKFEPNTSEFFEWCFENDKNVFLPFMKEIGFYKVNDKSDLIRWEFADGAHSSLLNNINIDVSVIPGVAFDKNNYRLGHGSGWYDRFLMQHDKIYKIGVCYKEQIIDEIEINKHDVAMDEVIVV